MHFFCNSIISDMKSKEIGEILICRFEIPEEKTSVLSCFQKLPTYTDIRG
jgi:hypothetical protein